MTTNGKEMESRLHTSLTSSLTSSLSTNLQSIIDKSLNDALEKMTSTMADLIASNPMVQQHTEDVNYLKNENNRLSKQVSVLEMEHDKLKHKLNQVEQRGLDHCLVLKGICEMAKENKNDCVELVYNAIANTIDAEDKTECKQAAKHMEIRRALRLGKYNENYDRQIAVEFTLKCDADYIMDNRSYLETGIYIDREYASDIEYRRKLLQPILRAARNQGRCRMDKDKWVILGRSYTLNNLQQLPEDLQLYKVSIKESEDCVGFFGALNPLSNFHAAPFKVDDESFISTEQFIQAKKVSFFGDRKTYNKIMSATTSLNCKNFARNIRNFNRKSWEAAAKEVCRPGIQAKFSQNSELLHLLVEKTSNKTIVECVNDRLWGTGIPLACEGCLDKAKWISDGILGELLMEIRDGQTVHLTNRLRTLSGPSLSGVTTGTLIGVTLTSEPLEEGESNRQFIPNTPMLSQHIPGNSATASVSAPNTSDDTTPCEEATLHNIDSEEGNMEVS